MRRLMLAVVVIALAGAMVASCGLGDSSRTVTFVAESSSGIVSGNYQLSPNVAFHVFVDEPSPYELVLEGEVDDYAILTVSGDGTLTAVIRVDGQVVREETGTTIAQATCWIE